MSYFTWRRIPQLEDIKRDLKSFGIKENRTTHRSYRNTWQNRSETYEKKLLSDTKLKLLELEHQTNPNGSQSERTSEDNNDSGLIRDNNIQGVISGDSESGDRTHQGTPQENTEERTLAPNADHQDNIVRTKLKEEMRENWEQNFQ